MAAEAFFFCRPSFSIAETKHGVSQQSAQWRRIDPEVVVRLLQALYEDVQDGVDVVGRYEDDVEVLDVRVSFRGADEVVVVFNVGYIERLGL